MLKSARLPASCCSNESSTILTSGQPATATMITTAGRISRKGSWADRAVRTASRRAGAAEGYDGARARSSSLLCALWSAAGRAGVGWIRRRLDPLPGDRQLLAFSVLAICLSAAAVAAAMVPLPVAIDSSAFCRMLPLSTFAQFGVLGTNQVSFAASPVDWFA